MPDSNFEVQYQTAMRHRMERDYGAAITLCSQLLNGHRLTKREEVLILELRGTCYLRARQPQQAEQDLQHACSLAQQNMLELEYIHATTSLVRVWIQQNRGHAATQRLLPRLEARLKGKNDRESVTLRASVASLYGVIYFRHGTGWYLRALACFEKAERLLERHNDPLRHLRNLSRLSYTMAWVGMRQSAWRCATDMIHLAQSITERGDPQSVFVGRYIKFACLLPVPTRLVLRPFRRLAGL